MDLLVNVSLRSDDLKTETITTLVVRDVIVKEMEEILIEILEGLTAELESVEKDINIFWERNHPRAST